MASDIWLRTILIVRKETRCHHIGYSYRLAARVLLYAPSHRQDNTYHGLCYTSRGALAGTRNSSMGPPHEGSIRRPIAPWTNALPLSYVPLLRGIVTYRIAHKTRTLCSVYLHPRNHFNFHPNDLQDLIDQLPCSFILMGYFNCHHTLWGCEEVNNRGLFNDKSHTYFHSAIGTFTLGSSSIFRDFSWRLVPTLVVVITFQLLTEADWYEFQHLCTCLQQSDMNDADDTMSFFHFHLEGHCRKNYS